MLKCIKPFTQLSHNIHRDVPEGLKGWRHSDVLIFRAVSDVAGRTVAVRVHTANIGSALLEDSDKYKIIAQAGRSRKENPNP
jgi:hypothetical protein